MAVTFGSRPRSDTLTEDVTSAQRRRHAIDIFGQSLTRRSQLNTVCAIVDGSRPTRRPETDGGRKGGTLLPW